MIIEIYMEKEKEKYAPLIFLHFVIFCIHRSRLYHIEIMNYPNWKDFRDAPNIIRFFPNSLKPEHCNNSKTVKRLELFTARRDKISGIGEPCPG